MEERFRESLFPGAPLAAVLSSDQAKAILDKIRLAAMAEELDVLDTNLVPMDDIQEEGHVSTVDPLLVAPQPDDLLLVSASDLSNDQTSFSGFLESAASGFETMPKHSDSSALSNIKSQHRSNECNIHSLSESTQLNKDAHKSSRIGGARGTTSHVEPQVAPTEPQPSGSGVNTTQTDPPISRSDLNNMVASLLQSIQPQLDNLQSQILSMSRSEEALMPSTTSLPPYDESNPWRSARHAPCQNNMLTLEGLGTRPLSDFEVFPPNGVFPYVFVRLSQSASIRDDKVPKETVLYPLHKAQNLVVQYFRKANCINTKRIPIKGNLAIFTTPLDFPNPFATKILEAANEAFQEDKEGAALREEESTSLIFPAGSGDWKNVVETFTGSKLSPDCFSFQFKEYPPKLNDGLINRELRCVLG